MPVRQSRRSGKGINQWRKQAPTLEVSSLLERVVVAATAAAAVDQWSMGLAELNTARQVLPIVCHR